MMRIIIVAAVIFALILVITDALRQKKYSVSLVIGYLFSILFLLLAFAFSLTVVNHVSP